MPGPLLPVPVHLQDSLDACGLACAEMVLCYLTNTVFQQTALVPKTITPPWATSPDQLCGMINDRLTSKPARYEVLPETSVNTAMDLVVAALNQNYPAVVLTDGDGHWVVVHGVTHAKSGSVTIHLKNSEPDRPSAGSPIPLPPHSATDECADEDVTNSQTLDGEVAACQPWAQFYMLPAKHAPVDKKFVVIAPRFPIPKAGLYSCSGPSHGKPIVDTSNIGDVAWSLLAETDLLSQPGWSALGKTPPPGMGAVPYTRVADLDSGDDYFLVLIANGAGTSVAVRVSQSTGDFLGALLQPSKRVTASVFAGPGADSGPAGGSSPATRFVWRYRAATFFSPFVPLIENADDALNKYKRPFDGKSFVDFL